MIEERIDEVIKTYQMYIEWNNRAIEKDKENLIFKINNGLYENIQLDAKDINMMKDDIDLYRAFIASLEYAKTGERK